MTHADTPNRSTTGPELPSGAPFSVLNWLDGVETAHERAAARFAENLAADSMHAIAWEAEDLIARATLARLAAETRRIMKDGYTDNLTDAFCFMIYTAHRDLMRFARDHGNSSGAGHRFVESARLAAIGELIESVQWHLGLPLMSILARAEWLNRERE